MRRSLLLWAVMVGVTWAGGGGVARADSGVSVYPAAYFAPFAPQTALDMVQRLPGFTLAAEASLRGFGAGAGNALIGGARPSSKAGGITEALARIPASQVERVELIRGAEIAGEAEGQSLVANVVLKAGAAAGTWKVEAERAGDGHVYPEVLDVNVQRVVAGWEVSARAAGDIERYPLRLLRLERDADGVLTQQRADSRPSVYSEGALSGEAAHGLAGGRLHLTARVGWKGYHEHLASDAYDAPRPLGVGPPDRTERSTYLDGEGSAELGADWTRTVLTDWSLKVIGLANGKTYLQHQSDTIADGSGRLQDREILRERQTAAETVARATLARGGASTLKPEFGAELAYNRLDSRLTLTDDVGSGPAAVALPAANVLVQELRGEAYAGMSWAFRPRWTLQGTLAAEASHIAVTGDAANAQTLFYFKPKVALIFDATPDLQFRLAARKTIGQLDFAAFAASVSTTNDRQNAGNPDLRPDQTLRLSAAVDWRRAHGAALGVELYREFRDDVLEYLLLPTGGAGLGNAGSAEVLGARVSASQPLDRLASGLLLKLDGEIKSSDVRDPFTGRGRELTGLVSPVVTVELRRDQPRLKLSYGAVYTAQSRNRVYYSDELQDTRTRQLIDLYAETTALRGFKVRLDVRHAATERYDRIRFFYAPDRSGTYLGSEERRSVRGAFVGVTLSSQF